MSHGWVEVSRGTVWHVTFTSTHTRLDESTALLNLCLVPSSFLQAVFAINALHLRAAVLGCAEEPIVETLITVIVRARCLSLCSHFLLELTTCPPSGQPLASRPAANHENMKECSTYAKMGVQPGLLPGPVTARPSQGAERGAMARAGPMCDVQSALANCCSSR